jgi:hypothetical protein
MMKMFKYLALAALLLFGVQAHASTNTGIYPRQP